MTVWEQKKVVEELKPLWIQLSQKADQLGLTLRLTAEHTDKNRHQWMLFEDVDITIKNGELRIRYIDPAKGLMEETTSLPADSEK